jgi:hypothetical protein
MNREERTRILRRLRELTKDDPLVMREARTMSDAPLWAYFKGFIQNSDEDPLSRLTNGGGSDNNGLMKLR